MVGLKNMETKKETCNFCGKNKSVTRCDKTKKPVCPDCSTVIPVAEHTCKSMIQVVAKRHAPKKHVAKLEKLAIKRGEEFEF
jgi:ribosomal protein S27AE|tara:strand:+ start:372 stop:617 length:246 start_codon:yes stop_codon:yes gene_type:complete